MSTGDHAPLPPSSAHLWVRCAGWRRMQTLVEPLPEDDTKTREGEAAHWAVARVLDGHQIGAGEIMPNGEPLTDEMCEGADLMDDAIGPERSSLMVESRVHCDFVHPDNWGTPDAWRLFDNTLDVWDYKFGHRHVPAFENWQLLNYAAAIVSTLGLEGRMPPSSIRVRLTIVQPRDYHSGGPVRTWELAGEELAEYARRLQEAARAADTPDALCTPHDHCGDCAARHACPALQQAALAYVETATVALPLSLPPAALARQLAVLDWAADLIKARRDGLAAQAVAVLRHGEALPGWTLKQGSGRERWKVGVEEVLALGAMMGVEVAKPDALTPKQAIKAGLPAEVVSAYTETPVGELKLVRDDGSAARLAFKQPT